MDGSGVSWAVGAPLFLSSSNALCRTPSPRHLHQAVKSIYSVPGFRVTNLILARVPQNAPILDCILPGKK